MSKKGEMVWRAAEPTGDSGSRAYAWVAVTPANQLTRSEQRSPIRWARRIRVGVAADWQQCHRRRSHTGTLRTDGKGVCGAAEGFYPAFLAVIQSGNAYLIDLRAATKRRDAFSSDRIRIERFLDGFLALVGIQLWNGSCMCSPGVKLSVDSAPSHIEIRTRRHWKPNSVLDLSDEIRCAVWHQTSVRTTMIGSHPWECCSDTTRSWHET